MLSGRGRVRPAGRGRCRRLSSGGEEREPARAVLLAVDDEPSVARAVERDLRSRYGREFRVLRAESGEDALAALRESKLRGSSVALLLVDQRMPGMSGVEFMEQAIATLAGGEARAADRLRRHQAAIDAINRSRLDHYLLKPWDPPEEQLYPVIDDLLDAWRADAPDPATGSRWSGIAGRAIARGARVPGPKPGALPLGGRPTRRRAGGCWPRPERTDATADGALPDGSALQPPTMSELAGRGPASAPAELPFYDLVIVGGGPAGLGAAVYGASEGLRRCSSSGRRRAARPGQSSRIENYLGFPDGVCGGELTGGPGAGAQVRCRADDRPEVSDSNVRGPAAGGQLRRWRRAIAAHIVSRTGVAYRQLEAPGLEELTGRGVYYGGALTEAASCADERGVHRRRRQLGRTGGGLLRPAARAGHAARPRRRPGRVHVATT